jgi:hypothetical protein
MEWIDTTKLKVGMILRLIDDELYEVHEFETPVFFLKKLTPGRSICFITTSNRGDLYPLYPFTYFQLYGEIETPIKPIKNIDKHLFV